MIIKRVEKRRGEERSEDRVLYKWKKKKNKKKKKIIEKKKIFIQDPKYLGLTK